MIPPYGDLHREHAERLLENQVPREWDLADGRDAYDRWIVRMQDHLHGRIWPRWDAAALRWTGRAEASMEGLTEYDLRLMERFFADLEEPVSSLSGAVSHEEMFLAEDMRGGRSPGWGIENYDRRLDGDLTGKSPEGMYGTGGDFLCGCTVLLLKQSLQRPRPHQMARWRLPASRPRLRAVTADTPSIISGHALEGCLAGGWVAMRHRCWVFDSARWAEVGPAFEQWMVDIGDRRVMAQVHYPSDNLASWYVALSFLEELTRLGAPAGAWMLALVARAIMRSRIYQAMLADSPPCPLWGDVAALVAAYSAEGGPVGPSDEGGACSLVDRPHAVAKV